MARVSTAKTRLTDAAMEMIWENSYGATSVDAICERADVRKGSFYYFFKSKSELAAAALEADWQKHQPKLDAIFSPTVAPLERFAHYFAWVHERLAALQKQCGCMLGCPLVSLGSEVCTQDHGLGDKIQEILDRKLAYFESAIRDAAAQGLIPPCDAKTKARALFAFYEGTLTQARIRNNVELLLEIQPAVLDLLGTPSPQPA